MYKIRVYVSKSLFRLARWIQPKEVNAIEKIEGSVITLSKKLTNAFGAGDRIEVKRSNE